MEEEKAAAYYDELTRKGEGAARFKQGLGFSSGANSVPERGSAIASSSSFLNQFVKASNPKSTENNDKDSEIRSIRDKLKKQPQDQQHPKVPERSYRESSERRRYRSRERDERDKSHRRNSRSRSTERRRSRYGDRERRRSRSRSVERRNRYGDTERRRKRSRSRNRSSSPRRERRRREDGKEKKIDYSRLIKGYDEMVYTHFFHHPLAFIVTKLRNVTIL